jgi:hypothetical protein
MSVKVRPYRRGGWEREVLPKVLALKPGVVVPPVTGGNISGRSKAARQRTRGLMGCARRM